LLFSSIMVKLLRCVALAVVVDQAQSALQCLGGSFTLAGTFAPEFATNAGYGTAMKNAVVSMSGGTSSGISADHVTASIVIGTPADGAAAGDCAAAIAASPAPTNAPATTASNSTTMAPATGTDTDTGTGTGTGTGTDTGPAPTPAPAAGTGSTGETDGTGAGTGAGEGSSTGTGGTGTDTGMTPSAGPSSGPSAGPAEMRLLGDLLDHEGRQLDAHEDTSASVSYTVVADQAIMAAIETNIGASSPEDVLAAVQAAITVAAAADSTLVPPTITGASAPTQMALQLDTRTAAPLASTGSEESFASKSFCSLVGLTLAATSILV